MEDRSLKRIAGGIGCDFVSGTSEFTARKGRIYCIIPNEDNSRIENITEELPPASGQGKREQLVTGRSYMSTKSVKTITLTGTSGSATISVGGVSKTATFDTSLTKTAENFVTANAADYLAAGIVLTSDDNVLSFTDQEAGTETTTSPGITNVSGDLSGTVATAIASAVCNLKEDKQIYPDYPAVKFTPAKGSFWVFYNYE